MSDPTPGGSPESAAPGAPSAILERPLVDPPRVAQPFPGLWHAVGLLVLIQVIANGIGLALLAPRIMEEVRRTGTFDGPLDAAGIGTIANSLAFGAVILLTFLKSRLPRRVAFPFGGIDIGHGLLAFVTLAGAVLVADFLASLFMALVPPPAEIVQMFEQFLTGSPAWLSFVFLVLVAPITEELFFRGVLQAGLRRRYGARTAIIASGLLFGVVHLIPWQVVPAIPLGLLFAWWTERMRSLWPALVGHALVNGTSWYMALRNPERDPLAPTFNEPWLVAAGALVLFLGLGASHRHFPRPDETPAGPDFERSTP
jgi:membrane protease YdiL (CAAX protease family)